MRYVFLLPAALLLLAACDSADPAAETPLAQLGTFEARITTPSAERVVAGTASPTLSDERGGTFGSFAIGENDELTLTAVELTADESGEAFVFIGITNEALTDGARFDIGFAFGEDTAPEDSILSIEQPDRFLAAYLVEDDGLTIGLGSDGAITFTEVTDEVLAGTFRFETRALLLDEGGVARTEPATVEGTFRTDRRERPDSDGRR